MRRPRHLSAEERALWDKVARTAERLHPEARQPAKRSAAPAAPRAKEPPRAPDPAPQFRVGEKANHSRDHDLMKGLSEQYSAAPLRMDSKTHTRLRRGKMRPEARIDLHGMTLSEAHPALTGFILSSHAAGRRLVLVITGKGRRRDDPSYISQRPGVLRHQVPQWLRMAPLASAVLQVSEAHVSHGGQGALYVYLSRRR